MNPLPESAVDVFIREHPDLARRYSRKVIAAHLARLAWRLHVLSLLGIDGLLPE